MSFKLGDIDKFLIETDFSVAKTIRDQIGHKSLYMLGVKDMAASDNSLHFKIKGSNKVSHIKITLTPADLYDIEFIKIRGANIKVVQKVEGIYADQLHEIIEKYTGLHTKL